eukprot:15473814-Alexandrium_andersonii.AAC.1
MTPNPPDEALEGDISGCFWPPSACYGLRIACGLQIAAGLGIGPDCRITDYSRTWEALNQASPSTEAPQSPLWAAFRRVPYHGR